MGRRQSYTPGTPCWVDLTTPDVEGAIAFYGAVHGWTAREVLPGAYWYLERDGAVVAGLSALNEQQRDAGMPPAWSMYVNVPDVGEAAARAEALGGAVAFGPTPIPDVGTMAAVADPQGGVTLLWQAGGFAGAEVVNEVGAWCWDDLQTGDPEAAAPFYEGLFGWSVTDVPGAGGAYRSIGHEGRAIAGIMRAARPIDRPYWTVYVGVEDVDAALRRSADAGGRVIVEPMSVPSGRFAVGLDPQGAMFCVLESTRYDD
ncbi:MAG TPA: VOC family protein [Baekduia sp.]|uniref:VOC family protein n=1 Tax=Baekduia sp. TaxID=2600305 RepID=UPI002D797A17|nr:VOC family protein [Baekduia sp.]HET6508269.1 VOC family protein [Baekduia sp.]